MTEEKVRCAYCGAERPKREMKYDFIFTRRRDARGKAVLEKLYGWYCADRTCQGYHQMAQEG